MTPAVRLQSLFRLDAQRVIEPALGQRQLDLAPFEPQRVAVAARRLVDTRHNRSVLAARQHPGGQRELVVEAKPAHVTGVEIALAVEIERLAEASRGEYRLAVADLALVQRAVEGEVSGEVIRHGPVAAARQRLLPYHLFGVRFPFSSAVFRRASAGAVG